MIAAMDKKKIDPVTQVRTLEKMIPMLKAQEQEALNHLKEEAAVYTAKARAEVAERQRIIAERGKGGGEEERSRCSRRCRSRSNPLQLAAVARERN